MFRTFSQRSAGSLMASKPWRMYSGLIRVCLPGERPAAPHRLLAIRQMGVIGDAVDKFTTNRMESTKEKSFSKMMALMLSVPKWTLKVWRDSMSENLNSWMMYIPGVSSSTEAKEIKDIQTMCSHLTPAELEDPSLVNGIVRARVAAASGMPLEQIQRIMNFYNQSRVMQAWIKVKQEGNEVLPASDVEMNRMAGEDPRVKQITQKLLYPTRRKSGRGRSMF